MKKSKYNFEIEKDGFIVLYNIVSEKMAVLEKSLFKMYSDFDEVLVHSENSQFLKFLQEKGFVVDCEVDESSYVIEKWKENDTSQALLGITIIPTLSCNMKCWYCYENHNSKGVMGKEVLLSIIKLIRKKIKNKNLKAISLSFFGGEPLLSFKTIVNPLLADISSLCKSHKKELKISFVTNGFLLDEKVLNAISVYGIPISFQITLDGNRECHNKVRTTKENLDSYSVILNNIKCALRHKFPIILRLNTTRNNIITFYDIVDDFKDLDMEYFNYLKCDIHRVWQDKGEEDHLYENEEGRLRSFLKLRGLNVSDSMKIQNYRCYADTDNQFVINYNGLLYRCTARDFTEQNAEGVLMVDGSEKFNENFEKRNKVKYGSPYCRKCIIFPLCHGGCSQTKLENMQEEACLFNYSESDKIKLVENKIDSILESKFNNTNH